ncbi:hypothetical protein N7465_006640 [Penicillium sp. CMV-2018d]|nr:hypothetical protein N7465_006640 [Penicillium sp. CMV-2018d]
MQAAVTFNDFLSNVDHRKAYSKYLQQLGQRILEQLYGPRILRGDEIASQSEKQSSTFWESVVPSALEEVEQQREIANEAEQERELQRPCFIHALEFLGLHQVIQDFVETGFLSGDDRPVNYVLLSMRADVARDIIPEEAELVIPILREHADPPTHLLLYAALFTKRMLYFNRLDYYSLPRLPT